MALARPRSRGTHLSVMRRHETREQAHGHAAERAMSCLLRRCPTRDMCSWSAGRSVRAGVGAWPEPRSASRASSGDSRHGAARLAVERTVTARQTRAPGKVSGAAWRWWLALSPVGGPGIAPPRWPECGPLRHRVTKRVIVGARSWIHREHPSSTHWACRWGSARAGDLLHLQGGQPGAGRSAYQRSIVH
jgi:hypothetical protein